MVVVFCFVLRDRIFLSPHQAGLRSTGTCLLLPWVLALEYCHTLLLFMSLIGPLCLAFREDLPPSSLTRWLGGSTQHPLLFLHTDWCISAVFSSWEANLHYSLPGFGMSMKMHLWMCIWGWSPVLNGKKKASSFPKLPVDHTWAASLGGVPPHFPRMLNCIPRDRMNPSFLKWLFRQGFCQNKEMVIDSPF